MIIFINILLLCIVNGILLNNTVIVSTEAKFPSVSLIDEIGEFFAAIDDSLFWKFTNFVIDKRLYNHTDKEIYNIVVKYSKSMWNEEMSQLINISLSIHTFAPFVEGQYNLAYQVYHHLVKDKNTTIPSTFAVIYDLRVLKKIGTQININDFLLLDSGTLFTSLELLVHFIENKNFTTKITDRVAPQFPVVLPVDHIFKKDLRLKDASILIVLYSSFKAPECGQWITTLKNLIKRENGKNFIFVFRHSYCNDSSVKDAPSMKLMGYGVELALRDMEYKFSDVVTPKKEENQTSNVDLKSNDFTVENRTAEISDDESYVFSGGNNRSGSYYPRVIMGVIPDVIQDFLERKRAALLKEIPSSQSLPSHLQQISSSVRSLHNVLIKKSLSNTLNLPIIKDIGLSTTIYVLRHSENTDEDDTQASRQLISLIDLQSNFPLKGADATNFYWGLQKDLRKFEKDLIKKNMEKNSENNKEEEDEKEKKKKKKNEDKEEKAKKEEGYEEEDENKKQEDPDEEETKGEKDYEKMLEEKATKYYEEYEFLQRLKGDITYVQHFVNTHSNVIILNGRLIESSSGFANQYSINQFSSFPRTGSDGEGFISQKTSGSIWSLVGGVQQELQHSLLLRAVGFDGFVELFVLLFFFLISFFYFFFFFFFFFFFCVFFFFFILFFFF
jgi:hypothetical protein